LLGYDVKGHKACHICKENTTASIEIRKENNIYVASEIFSIQSSLSKVKKKHLMNIKRMKMNQNEPIPLNGFQIYEKVNKIHHVFGKTSKKLSTTSP